MAQQERQSVIDILLEFSIPLLSGVVVALLAANLAPDWYHHALHWKPFGDISIGHHSLDLHFIVDDLFMVLFFGIAAKEITESCLPGGSLSPVSKALNPLFATLGGVVGPVLVFFVGLEFCFANGVYTPADDMALLSRGWGIPTATDIALAWLVARTVFGKGHPAINFLLLLAIADDAIGLVIIAVFYGNPELPPQPMFLGLCLLGMAAAWAFRWRGVTSWLPYVLVGGPLAWAGLFLAHLHPALALVFIVPFLPGPHRDTGLFRDEDEVDVMGGPLAKDLHVLHSPLHQFEHQIKGIVDVGLFFFAFANAGVVFAQIGTMTWLILGALVVGKTVGVTLLGMLARALGLGLPHGMSVRDLVMAGFIAALGLTVALFVATAAFVDPLLQGQAKMGALFSGFVGLAAILLGRVFGFGSARSGSAELNESPRAGSAEESNSPC